MCFFLVQSVKNPHPYLYKHLLITLMVLQMQSSEVDCCHISQISIFPCQVEFYKRSFKSLLCSFPSQTWNWQELELLWAVYLKVCLNRYSWGAGKVGSEYSSWFIWLECFSWRFLTMSRLSRCLYQVGSCRNSSEYSKTLGNFLPLLLIRFAQKIVWDIFTIISSDPPP